MNILVLTDEIFPDGFSGISKSVFNECAALVRRGHRVTVLVRSVNSSLPLETTLDGIYIFRFNGPARQETLYHLYPVVILYAVNRWLRHHRESFDVIYTFNPLYILPTQWTKAHRRTAIVHVFYSSIADEIRINAQRGKYGRLGALSALVATVLGILEKSALSRADVLLPRSEYTLQTLQRLYPQASVQTILPTGVDITHYKPQLISEARVQLDLPAERPIFITVRRLEGRMGLHNLIEAVRQVQKTCPDILLLIAGKGYLRASLEAMTAENGLSHNIRFLGFVSEDDLPLYLAAADLFVLPTEMLEGFGLATIEALAVGLPVIGTPVGATPEILTPIEPKLVSGDSSPGALAEIMNYWLDHPDDLTALKARCRTEVEQRYDADVIAQGLETLFQATVK